MVRLISRQCGGLAALKLTKLFGIDDFPAAMDSGKVLIIIILLFNYYYYYIQRDVEFNESDFGQKSAMTTEQDQKSMEVKQNVDITAKDEEEEEEAEIRRSEEDEE